MSNSTDIDLVFPWVDGSDPVWKAQREQYDEHYQTGIEGFRFRDWDQLKFVFRSIDKNLPWIRKVHFITNGQLPDWLNPECPRLNIIFHEEYIPAKWLPTFNSHTIELNLHRVAGLSEKFIYSNDDVFFLKPCKPTDFFAGNLPKSQAGFTIFHEVDSTFLGILNADMMAINRHFSSKQVFRKNLFRFIHYAYGLKDNMKTLLLAPWCRYSFPGFHYYHGPNAYLKSTLEEVWEKDPELMEKTCSHRFRTNDDINQYFLLWWQWCKGRFVPESMNRKLLTVRMNEPTETLTRAIENDWSHFLCLIDCETDCIEEERDAMHRSFDRILGEKSQFER